MRRRGGKEGRAATQNKGRLLFMREEGEGKRSCVIFDGEYGGKGLLHRKGERKGKRSRGREGEYQSPPYASCTERPEAKN